MINWGLKKLIVERCGSQVDFSMKIARSQSHVSEIVRGRRPLSDEEKEIWAKALNVNPAIIEQVDERSQKMTTDEWASDYVARQNENGHYCIKLPKGFSAYISLVMAFTELCGSLPLRDNRNVRTFPTNFRISGGLIFLWFERTTEAKN